MSGRLVRAILGVACAASLLAGCGQGAARSRSAQFQIEDRATPEARRFAEAAAAQVGRTTIYDAAYVEIDYPGGDVPIERGVCSDVVVRAMRDMGVDLQVLVHEDMTEAFAQYPHRWALTKPDPNIDHRRVPNLVTFFRRRDKALRVTKGRGDYQPGDLVTWGLMDSKLPHIGIVSTQRSADSQRFMIVHNIGAGTQIEDVLFDPAMGRITGHFRWF